MSVQSLEIFKFELKDKILKIPELWTAIKYAKIIAMTKVSKGKPGGSQEM